MNLKPLRKYLKFNKQEKLCYIIIIDLSRNLKVYTLYIIYIYTRDLISYIYITYLTVYLNTLKRSIRKSCTGDLSQICSYI